MRQRLKMKKVTAFFTLLMVGMAAMTGCGSIATEESKIVQVQSINGNEITAVVGELAQETGEPPERPAGNDGQQSSLPSSVERKPGGDSAKAGRTAFTAGEETLTFTVAEDTAIILEFAQALRKAAWKILL